MLSLKDLAAQAIPKDVEEGQQDTSHDIASIVEHNRTKIKTCSHGTTWTYRRNKVNGPVTYTCGCVEQWKDDEYRNVVNCDSRVCVVVGCEWGYGSVWGVCGWGGEGCRCE